MPDEERLRQARTKVAALKSFYSHLITYLVVNSALFVINYVTARGNWWFLLPLIGWGIGLALHGLGTLTNYGLFGRTWEERRIKEIMEKEERGKG